MPKLLSRSSEVNATCKEGRAHYWIIDENNIGRCKNCPATRAFPVFYPEETNWKNQRVQSANVAGLNCSTRQASALRKGACSGL